MHFVVVELLQFTLCCTCGMEFPISAHVSGSAIPDTFTASNLAIMTVTHVRLTSDIRISKQLKLCHRYTVIPSRNERKRITVIMLMPNGVKYRS